MGSSVGEEALSTQTVMSNRRGRRFPLACRSFTHLQRNKWLASKVTSTPFFKRIQIFFCQVEGHAVEVLKYICTAVEGARAKYDNVRAPSSFLGEPILRLWSLSCNVSGYESSKCGLPVDKTDSWRVFFSPIDLN